MYPRSAARRPGALVRSRLELDDIFERRLFFLRWVPGASWYPGGKKEPSVFPSSPNKKLHNKKNIIKLKFTFDILKQPILAEVNLSYPNLEMATSESRRSAIPLNRVRLH